MQVVSVYVVAALTNKVGGKRDGSLNGEEKLRSVRNDTAGVFALVGADGG
jgi:hypothetical protein